MIPVTAGKSCLQPFLRLYKDAITRNMEKYGVFAATERLLMALVRRGADRQVMHEIIRRHAMTAWAAVHQDNVLSNPLPKLLCEDPTFLEYLSPIEIMLLLDATKHIGEAPERSRAMAEQVRAALTS
jgi:adenylosuccinate lyase